MAITGRKPKPEGTTVHRNKVVHDWTEVQNVPFVGGPKLPARRWNGRTWDKRVRQKWAAWSSMPHCSMWSQATWEFAFDTIEIAALVQEGETRLSNELRAREKTLGTTPESLRDLRIRYVEPKQSNEGDSEAGVTNIAEYRDF